MKYFFWASVAFLAIGCAGNIPGEYSFSPPELQTLPIDSGPQTVFLFAEEYQFHICDLNDDPYESMPTFSEAASKRGWTKTQNAVVYLTRADSWNHRLDIAVHESFEPDPNADLVSVHNLDAKSGVLNINETYGVPVPAGIVAVYVSAFNLENDIPSTGLSETEILSSTEYERYSIDVVPGPAKREGTLD